MMFRFLLPFILTIVFSYAANTQECTVSKGSLYGSQSTNERGYCLEVAPDGNSYYVVGLKSDSILLFEVDLTGAVLWSREIDIIPNLADHVSSMIVDSEGMLAFIGIAGSINTGGRIFAFRYDPSIHQVLWAKEYDAEVTRDYSNTILQKGIGGNYVVSTNPHNDQKSNNDCQVFELDKDTGDKVPEFSKNYHLGNSEAMNLVFDGNFIYGIGRFTAGPSNAQMRNTIVKLNPEDGTPVWVRMGHIPLGGTARLYGISMVIDSNVIFSGYHGDPAGTSTSSTNMYLQKTDLDGNLIWLNQYELPGSNDVCHGIIKSGDGYVVLAGQRAPTDEIYLFKVDTNGAIEWSNVYQFASFVQAPEIIGGLCKLIQVQENLIFTGYATNSNGNTDIILVKTNLNGEADNECATNQPVTIPVTPVNNPSFVEVGPIVTQANHHIEPLTTTVRNVLLDARSECILADTIFSSVTDTICSGETLEGYTLTGQYVDVFITPGGCDSIRTLNLTVIACQPECGGNSGGIYGTSADDERGNCLVATTAKDGYYFAGTRNDSVLLILFTLDGQVVWTRTFDIVPGIKESVSSMLLDSEGMIVIAGTAGVAPGDVNGFIFRYAPNGGIWWSNIYKHTEREYFSSIIQKGPGNNYVLVGTHSQPVANRDEANVIEIDKNTGAINPALAKGFSLWDTEGLYEIVYDGEFLYATGRYKDVDVSLQMRNTITKLDPVNGDLIWVRLGHLPASGDARLYGSSLVVDEDKIISGYHGDPDGQSLTDTKVFFQRTSLDGDVVWVKQYEIPGLNDVCYGVVKSGNGYVFLIGQQSSASNVYLVKIDSDGNILWSKTFNFPSFISELKGGNGSTEIIEVGNQLIFTANGINSSGKSDIVVIRTDLNGNVNIPCINSEDVTIPVSIIQDAVFYSVAINEFDIELDVSEQDLSPIVTSINTALECFSVDTVFTSIDTTICRGQSIEGYSTSGEYIDIFEAANGCDSIRTINLTVLGCDPIIHWGLEACESYMSNGSHMIFTEFVPDYPTILTCADVDADHVDMEPSPMSKHSCTPGVNGTVAMCIGASPSCTYNPGEVTSLIISFSVEVPQDSSVQITGFEFFEKAPATYTWIDGPSGPNNYPRFYGIRILKNGTEIFQQSGISTTGNWTLQRFDFLTDSLFTVDEDADFRIELLPYCPVGNGAEVSAWDIDEIRVFGGCIPFVTFPIIGGDVATRNGKLIPNTYLHLADNHAFDLITTAKTDADGRYLFDDLRLHTSYYVKGYNNGNVLQGVSTLDLIMMQRHLLGIQPLSTLHQYIAADINHNGAVSIIDIVELRKMLLGFYTEFPKNTSWRFGVLPQDFTGTDISTFTEVSSIEAIQDGITIINFEGIKIGDVNEDIRLNLHGEPIITRNADNITFRIDDAPVSRGNAFTLVVTSENIDELQGFQLALMCHDLSLVSVDGAALPVSDENISFTDEGLLRMSWNEDRSYAVVENEVLFTITFMASSPGMISDKISVQQNGLQPEAYTGSDLKAHELNIEFERAEQRSEINSLRIEPNPLTTQASVRFTLSTGGETVINFFDLSGKLVYSIQKEYAAGDHTEHINAKDLISGDGVIYCQLVCNGYTSIQKLVLLK